MRTITEVPAEQTGARISDGMFKKTIASILASEVSVADALAASRKLIGNTTEKEQSFFQAGATVLQTSGSRRSAVAFMQAVGIVDIRHIATFCPAIQNGFIAINQHVTVGTGDLSPGRWDKPLLSMLRRALYAAEHIDDTIGRECLMPAVLKIAQAKRGTDDYDCMELAIDVAKYLCGNDATAVLQAASVTNAMEDAMVVASSMSNGQVSAPSRRMAA